MKAVRFMRQPFFVTGVLVTEDNMDAVARWCEGHVIEGAEGPFIRVPVNRATNKKQTEAYPGTWVLLSIQRGVNSFKVYTEEWLRKSFIEIPDEEIPKVEINDEKPSAKDENQLPSNVRPFAGPATPGNNIPTSLFWAANG